MIRARTLLCSVVGVAAALAIAPASACATSTIDLLTQASAEIDGPAANARLGTAVGGNGDVSGDGVRDVLLGAAGAYDGFVVFGRVPDLLNLGSLSGRGYTLSEADDTVADAGDVNGDGLRDYLVAQSTAYDRLSGAGAVWVVFGSSSTAAVNIDALGSRGFRIDGAAAQDYAGAGAAAAGDVNGDGRDDILIGAYKADPGGRAEAGASYVVFGKTSTTDVNLGRLGSGGYVIEGANAGDWSGISVANTGDVNGDGRPDQLIGASHFDRDPTYPNSGAAYVVFGKANTTPVSLATLGGSGYRITGAGYGDALGGSVDGAGDVNEDGRQDQLIAAGQAGPDTEGIVYVVFGRIGTSPVQLGSGSGGYEIRGAVHYDLYIPRVTSLADFNGDGTTDAAIGTRNADHGGRTDSGSVYVVYGKSSTTPVELDSFTGGFRADGAMVGAQAGYSVAGPGNVHGDGKRDLLLGSPFVTANGRTNSGAAYVVDGGSAPTPPIISQAQVTNVRISSAGRAGAAAAAAPTIRYRLSKPASVTLRLFRIQPGRKRLDAEGAARCVAARGRVLRAQACNRWVSAGVLRRKHVRAGTQRVKGRRLPAGRYVLVAYARDSSGHVHGPEVVRFRLGG